MASETKTGKEGTSHGGVAWLADRHWILLGALVVVAFWLRIMGITFGLPFRYHFDEMFYVNTARGFSWESPHPSFGPLHILALLESKLLSWLLPLIERLPLSPRMEATFDSPVLASHLLWRSTSALLGAAAVIPIYLVGRDIWGRRVGLLAACFLAFTFMHVRISHYGTLDATTTFLVAWSCVYCVRLYRRGALRDYLLAGLFAGLAFPTKQLSWPLFVLILLFHLFALERGGGEGDGGRDEGPSGHAPRRSLAQLGWRLLSGRLWTAYGIAVAAFLATSPQVVMHTKEYFSYWRLATTIGAGGGLDRMKIDEGVAWKVYLSALRWGLGEILLLLCVAGLVFVWLRRRPLPGVLLTAFPVLYVAFLLKPGNIFLGHYILVTVPLLLLPAAALVVAGLEALRWKPVPKALAAAAVVTLAIAEPAWASLRHGRLLRGEDTRNLSKRWIEENVPEGSFIVVESLAFAPQLDSPQRPAPLSRRTFKVVIKGIYGLSQKVNRPGPPGGVMTVDDYLDMGAEYVIANGFTSRSPFLDPEEEREKREFYESLDRRAELVKEFSPHPPGQDVPWEFEHAYGPATHLGQFVRSGPRIKIYRLPRPG